MAVVIFTARLGIPIMLKTSSARPGGTADIRHPPVRHYAIKKLQRGTFAFHEGELAKRRYLIVQGTILLCRDLGQRRGTIVALAEAGATIGSSTAGKYPYSAKAATSVTLRALGPNGSGADDQWQELRHVAKQITEIHGNTHIVRGLTARQRLARFIVSRIPARDLLSQTPLVIRLPINRADLSNFLALRVTSVSRAFAQFKREGNLNYDRGQELTILRPDVLAAIACKTVQKQTATRATPNLSMPVDLFGLPADVARAILAQSKVEIYQPNKIIFRQGNRASYCFVVVDGWMLLERRRPNGKRALLDILTKGHSIAAASVAGDGNYLVSGIAATETTVVSVPDHLLRQMLLFRPEFGLVLAAGAAAHIERIKRQITQLQMQNGDERIVEFLLDRAGQTSGTASFHLPFEKRHLAALLDIAPSNLSRSLIRLRAHGIKIWRTRVAIRDVEKLRDLLARGAIRTVDRVVSDRVSRKKTNDRDRSQKSKQEKAQSAIPACNPAQAHVVIHHDNALEKCNGRKKHAPPNAERRMDAHRANHHRH